MDQTSFKDRMVSLTIRNVRQLEKISQALMARGIEVTQTDTDYDYDCGWFGFVRLPLSQYDEARKFVEENF